MAKKIVITEENMAEIAAEIIISGFQNEAEEDNIKAEMVKRGISFGKVNSLFKSIAIQEGLIVDPAIIQQALDAEVNDTDWSSVDSYSQFCMVVDQIVTNVEGATHSKVVSMAKKFCKENEIELPKAEKVRKARVKKSGVAGAVANYFAREKSPTRMGLYDEILPEVKGHDNAVYYVNQYFVLAFALVGGMDIESASIATKLDVMTFATTEIEEEMTDDSEE